MALIPENSMERILNGDNVTPQNRNEYFVKKAIDNAGQGGGGADLPEPGNVGNVLTDNGTAWVSAAPAEDIYYFGFSIGETMETTASVSEMIGLLAQNKRVVAHVSIIPGTVCAVVPAVSYTPASVYFSAVGDLGGSDTMLSFEGSTDGETDTWSPLRASPVIPTPTASDYLKVLKVGRQSDGQGGYTYLYGLDNDKTPLIVHGTISGSTVSLSDTTLKDIYDAKIANRAVFFDDGDGFRWELTGALYNTPGETYLISFSCLKHGTVKIVAAALGISGTADTITSSSVLESDLTLNT